MNNLYQHYQVKIKDTLAKELNISNTMAIPRMVKIVINVGIGEALENKKVIENVVGQLSTITGQKPSLCLAKKDISSFKLRKGEIVGVKVTLRGKRMYDFLEKLVKIVLPRIRDFRGVPTTSLDGKGGYTLGLSEQIVFPEIEYSQVDKVRGLEITFVTTGKDKTATRKLLELLGIAFSKH